MDAERDLSSIFNSNVSRIISNAKIKNKETILFITHIQKQIVITITWSSEFARYILPDFDNYQRSIHLLIINNNNQ